MTTKTLSAIAPDSSMRLFAWVDLMVMNRAVRTLDAAEESVRVAGVLALREAKVWRRRIAL